MARIQRWDRSLSSGQWTEYPGTRQVQLTGFITPNETVTRVRFNLGFLLWDNGSDYIGNFNALRPVTIGLYFRPAGDVTPQMNPVADRDDQLWMWWQNIPPTFDFQVAGTPGQAAIAYNSGDIDCRAMRRNNTQVAQAVYLYVQMFQGHTVNSAWYSVGASVNVLLAP